jgi:hypothetical protein
MPADAITGIFEAVFALFEILIEALVLAIELAAEVVCLLVELLCYLFGKRRRITRPAWIERRRAANGSRKGSIILASLFLAAAGFFAWQFRGFTRLNFSSNGFTRPDGVSVVLFRNETSQPAIIERGKLTVLRGRWDTLKVRDARYRPASFAIAGRRMDLTLEKIPTTRETATKAVINKAADMLREKLGNAEKAAPKKTQ